LNIFDVKGDFGYKQQAVSLMIKIRVIKIGTYINGLNADKSRNLFLDNYMYIIIYLEFNDYSL